MTQPNEETPTVNDIVENVAAITVEAIVEPIKIDPTQNQDVSSVSESVVPKPQLGSEGGRGGGGKKKKRGGKGGRR